MRGLVDTLTRLSSPWAYIVVGVLATAEAVLVGLVLPGELALLLGGFLAYERHVSLAGMVLVAAVASVAGYLLGYEVGRRVGPALRDGPLGRRIGKARWQRAQDALAARGGQAILVGRFVGVLRALLPTAAGMARMPYRPFLAYTVIGGLIWAPGFVLLGYLAGGSYQRVADLAGQASLLLLALLVLLGAVAATARFIAHHPRRVQGAVARQLDRPRVRALRRRYATQLAFLTRRLRPGGALGLSLTVTVLALAGAGWAFGALLQDVLGHDETALLDPPVQAFFVAHREAWLTHLMRAVTDLGGAALLIPLAVGAGLLWRWRTGIWRPLLLLASAYAGAWLLQISVKQLTHRPRPPAALALDAFSGYAFPSGHATDAAAVYGMLAALLAASTPRWSRKVTVWAVAAGLVLLVGLSRVYLGGHWLTDVLGGFALGAAWLFALLTITHTIDGLHTGAAATASPGHGGVASDSSQPGRRHPPGGPDST
jgi:membrane protein DedA with SNARE-associated domain/membrane-associated phospholipid phosphatase